jgi:hypothetical protein
LIGWELGGGSGRSGGTPWFRSWGRSAAARWGSGVCSAARFLCCWLGAPKFCRGSWVPLHVSPCGGEVRLISAPLENPRQVEEASWSRGAPAASLVPHLMPSDPGPPGRVSSLSQTPFPLPDIPPSLRQPSLSQTFFSLSLSDIRPFLRQPSLSQTFFPLSDIFTLPRTVFPLSDILTSPRHPSSPQTFVLLPDILPPLRHSSSSQTVWLISDCLPSHIHSSFSHSFFPLSYSPVPLLSASIPSLIQSPFSQPFFLLSGSLTYLRYSSFSPPSHSTNREI